MKLRTRLFLWVGIIFISSSLFSLVFQGFFTDKSLKDAEEELRSDILQADEVRRGHIEEYLNISLTEDRARIDSLMLRFLRDKAFGAKVYLDGYDIFLEAPARSALFYKGNLWIDFIQSTKNGKLTSSIIPINYPMKDVHKIPINEKLAWIVFHSDTDLARPMMGVAVDKGESDGSEANAVALLVNGYWGLYALFDPLALLPITEEYLSKQAVNTPLEREPYAPFLANYVAAGQYMRDMTAANGGKIDWITRDVQAKIGKGVFDERRFEDRIKCVQGDVLNAKIIQLMQEGDQSILIASLANLYATGAFGAPPFNMTQPVGMTRFVDKSNTGPVIMEGQVFHHSILFDAETYLQRHPSQEACLGLANAIGIFSQPETNRVFVVNAANIVDPNDPANQGSLTVGIDADSLVQDLVFSTREMAFLVHKGTIYSAFTSEGIKIDNPTKQLPFDPSMLSSKSGTFNWHGENYYYLQMTPFPDVDIHFFLVTQESKAFALIRQVQTESKDVIRTISFNMQLIAMLSLLFVLILLHNVAKRITEPIAKLALVTEDVAKGRLEGIELPKMRPGEEDEISSLCTSFEQMIKGLQEKEKVKGVLNKVVSTEIAEEILKGQIHLGGEEKVVTVLFADIRGFTKMTAAMDPIAVIELLNACMTKISRVIDEHGGVIDKYVGDEVMALFGAPIEKERSALNSVLAAREILRVIEEWNRERKEQGKPPVELGIGIHSGVMLVGNMGAENRLNYTVLGRNVNFASRLCSNAAPGQILISNEVLERPFVKESILVQPLAPLTMKGFDEPVIVYAVKGEKDAQ